MSIERTIRARSGSFVGQLIDLMDPQGVSRWVVVNITVDPDAIWNLTFDADDPDASPETWLLHLRPVR